MGVSISVFYKFTEDLGKLEGVSFRQCFCVHCNPPGKETDQGAFSSFGESWVRPFLFLTNYPDLQTLGDVSLGFAW